MDVRERREPLLPQQVDEGRAVEGRLDLRPVLEGGEGDAPAGAVGLEQRGEAPADPGDHARQGRQVGQAVLVQQHAGVPGRQAVAARRPVLGRLRSVRLDHLQDVGHGLLLQPLAGVALVDPRPSGELGGRGRPAPGEGAVEAQPVAQADRQEVERPQGRLEQPAGEGLRPLLLGRPAASAASLWPFGGAAGGAGVVTVVTPASVIWCAPSALRVWPERCSTSLGRAAPPTSGR